MSIIINFSAILNYNQRVENLGRIPAPKGTNLGSSCEEGLQQPTCKACQKYYDPHTASGYGNNERGKCVWVPLESKCYAKKMAEENNWDFDETCSGSLDYK